MQYKFELHGKDAAGFTHAIICTCCVAKSMRESVAIGRVFRIAMNRAALERRKDKMRANAQRPKQYLLYAIYRVAGKGMAQEAILIWMKGVYLESRVS